MTIYLPIVGYAPAEGAGAKASTPDGVKNTANLKAVLAAMSWIEAQSDELITSCPEEYRHLKSPFHYVGGARVAFDDDLVFRTALGKILKEFKMSKFCLLVPSRQLFFDDFENEYTRILWDRKEHGIRGQVLSVHCDEYPLDKMVGRPRHGIFDYLCENVLRSNNYLVNWVNGVRSRPATSKSGTNNAW